MRCGGSAAAWPRALNGQGEYAEAELQLRDLQPQGAVDIVSVRMYLAAAQLGLG